MDFYTVFTLAVVFGCIGLMIVTRIGPELILMGGVVILTSAGAISPTQALEGLANPGLVTVALMFVIVAGIRETGGIDFLVTHVLGQPKTNVGAQARLLTPALLVSGFLNNTPVVATFIPAVMAWAPRINISPSKLLIPLSYVAMLGGTMTLIGTSTNLTVNGLLIRETGEGMGMFDIAWVGAPTAIVGFLYLLLCSNRLLPDRQPVATSFSNPREYTVEMEVAPDGPLVGKTIQEAGLRHLQGLFLIAIERGGRLIPSVSSDQPLQANDQLVFAGVIESVVELHRIRGLNPAGTSTFSLNNGFPERRLIEVVISPRCEIIGQTIREGRFRARYGASVVAVARNGERIDEKIGLIRLQPADTLLLTAGASFLEHHRHSREFLLISEVANSEVPRYDKAWLSWTILGGVVLSASFGWLSMLNAAMLGVAGMLITGCLTPTAARNSLDAPVLLAIAAALALGEALQATGAAEVLAMSTMGLMLDQPLLLLAATYILTVLMTSVVTNNAAAVLMFPVVMAVATAGDLNYMPFLATIMMAASASFATPISYQTNLMVYGPGNYQFSDFLRLGLPLTLLTGIVAVVVTPWVWPL